VLQSGTVQVKVSESRGSCCSSVIFCVVATPEGPSPDCVEVDSGCSVADLDVDATGECASWELGRMTPSLKRSCTEIEAGRFGDGVTRLRRRCGMPVFLKSREGNI
jgi:hypothetical protein